MKQLSFNISVVFAVHNSTTVLFFGGLNAILVYVPVLIKNITKVFDERCGKGACDLQFKDNVRL